LIEVLLLADLVVVVAAVGWIWRRSVRARAEEAAKCQLEAAECRLKALCGGGDEQVWRLTKYERRRRPGISQLEAVNRAIDRYKYDQGR
jgi:hypothetical protein